MSTQPATLRDVLGKEARINTTAFRQEEAQQAIEVHHAEVDAPIVEENRHIGTPIPVSPGQPSGFDIFVDGIEMSSVAAWAGGLPIRIGHVAAAAVGRREGEMNDFVSERLETVILVPAAMADQTRRAIKGLEGVGKCSVLTVESTTEGHGPTLDWHLVLREAISKRREELERDVIVDVVRSRAGAWVTVDGGVARYRSDIEASCRVVGLVKSHRHYYFTPETVVASVFPLPAGHRTPVFEAALSKDSMPTYSWYLRLHASEDGPPWFGLVRIELCDRDAALRHAEDISSWMLAERAPLSLPDARYDRLIYPIRFIEQYLRARQPSRWHLRALIGCA